LVGFVLLFSTSLQNRISYSNLDSLLKNGDRLIDDYKLDSSVFTLSEALDMAIILEDSLKIRRVYGDLGYVHHLSGNYEASIANYKLAYQYAEGLLDTVMMGSFSRSIGVNFQRLGLHSVSLDYYLRSLDLAKSGSDTKLLATLYNSLGVLYQQNQDWEKSLDYHRKSLTLFEKINNERGIARNYNNMAISFKENHLDSCILYNLLALELKKKLGNKRDISSTLNNLGEIYLDLSLEDSAFLYIQDAFYIHRELNEPESMIISYNGLADYWQRKNNYQISELYLDSAAQLIQQIPTKELHLENLLLKIKLYENTNRYPQALQTYKSWDSIKTELFLEEKFRVQEMGNLYLLREKEYENEQVASRAALLEVKNSQFKTTSLLLGIIGLLAMAFAGITSRNLRVQKRQSHQILRQNEIIKNQKDDLRHRTSNSLSRCQGIIHSIARKIDNVEVRQSLRNAARILLTASEMERHLIGLEDEKEVHLGEFLASLIEHHLQAIQLENRNIQIIFRSESRVHLPVDQVVSISVIINEWITNSLKYAFDEKPDGRIFIQIMHNNNSITIDYKDNGKGFSKSTHLGMGSKLNDLFLKELKATLNTSNENGTKYLLNFPFHLTNHSNVNRL